LNNASNTRHRLLCCTAVCLVLTATANEAPAQDKLRVIVETDIGGDADDQASLVRFLLYANEWDVEGIIADRHASRFHNDPARNHKGIKARDGYELAQAYLDAYAEVHENLKRHADYPAPDELRRVLAPGWNDTDEGVKRIIAAADRDDPRPIWYGNWGSNSGAQSNLRRALDRVKRERTPAEYETFVKKFRICTLDGPRGTKQGHEDQVALHIETGYHDVGGRWYHRFRPLTQQAGGFDVRRDVQKNHGPLGALYTTPKEGDSWTFVYLIPNGLSDPNQPTWASWAGRYGPRAGDPLNNSGPSGSQYYWANQQDTVDGQTSRDNTASRWAAHLQNDFRARLDWCVADEFAAANHQPAPHCQGDATRDVLRLQVPAGSSITLDAAGTSDPDGDGLAYYWFVHPESGTYGGPAAIRNHDQPQAELFVPADAAGTTIHAILQVTDDGQPPLTHYRRVVVTAASGATHVSLADGRWQINGRPTNPGSAAEGLLMNVRMVNATFEDTSGKHPDFDVEANADEFIARIADYAAHGVNAFTLNLQGGMPGYEGAVNSAYSPDGSLRPEYLARVERVIRACDEHGVVVILGCYYQRQSKILRDEAAVRAGLVHAAQWIQARGFTNVVLEVVNEFPHRGFVHPVIRDSRGQASLIRLVKETAPQLLVTSSGYGDGLVHPEVARACDFLTPHWNGTQVEDIPARIEKLKQYGKPIVCNEDDKVGQHAVAALKATVAAGAGYGLMLKDHNQTYPFRFDGVEDDPVFYEALDAITSK